MWPTMRALLVTLLIASTATLTAALSFVASVQEGGRDVDASRLKFVPIPPARHRKHPSRSQSQSHSHPGKHARDVISYSSNWCGASQHADGPDEVANVFSYFTVPDLTLRPGAPAPQFAAAWVGIDGAECRTALLQAGVTTIVNSDGGQSASAWWEWYPEAAYTIEGLEVKPGDWMSVNISATDATSGTIVITNAQRGSSVTLVISNGPRLCRVDAEWIVEDLEDSVVEELPILPLAHFSDVWFMEASATTVDGKHMGIDGAAMVHLQDETGTVICKAAPYDDANFVISSHG